MGGNPTITTTIERVLTPGQEARQLRRKTNAAVRDVKRTGKAGRREVRRLAAEQQLPPTFLGRTAYHAGSVRDLIEIVAAIGVAAVAIRQTWQVLQTRHNSEEAPNADTESTTQDHAS